MEDSNSLPLEIMHLISDELNVNESYGTMVNLASSKKAFAPIALERLYRYIAHLRSWGIKKKESHHEERC